MTWMTYDSPFGPLTLAGRADALCNVYFPGRAPSLAEADRDPLRSRTPPRSWSSTSQASGIRSRSTSIS
jgi:hypothetical protein